MDILGCGFGIVIGGCDVGLWDGERYGTLEVEKGREICIVMFNRFERRLLN